MEEEGRRRGAETAQRLASWGMGLTGEVELDKVCQGPKGEHRRVEVGNLVAKQAEALQVRAAGQRLELRHRVVGQE